MHYVPHHPIPLKSSTHFKKYVFIHYIHLGFLGAVHVTSNAQNTVRPQAARPKHLIGDLAINLFGGLVSDHLDASGHVWIHLVQWAGFMLDLYLLFLFFKPRRKNCHQQLRNCFGNNEDNSELFGCFER